ncbi:putative pyridoxal kinase Bud16p [Diutina rugosa]
MGGTVLSIQSHVAHGYVGNKAAVFPLQCLGWDVDVVNTVNFSNHTGYGKTRGTTMDPNELQDIFSQLDSRLNLSYDAMLTGYIPNAALIRAIGRHAHNAKQRTPDMMYLLDPVMGDNGYMYVDKSCIDEYRTILESRVVDIITPNQYELELLVQCKIDTPQQLEKAMDHAHRSYGVTYCVVSSVTFGNSTYCAFSTLNQPPKLFHIPLIKSYFTGVGDLFAAVLLDRLYTSRNIETALSEVLEVMAKTLALTHKAGVDEFHREFPGQSIESKINDGTTMRYFELRVIQAKSYFHLKESPFRSQHLDSVSISSIA